MTFRLIPPLEKDRRLVEICQKPVGCLGLLLIFTGLLAILDRDWLLLSAFLVVVTFFPRHRYSVLAVAFAVVQPLWLDPQFLFRMSPGHFGAYSFLAMLGIVTAGVYAALAVCAALAFRFPKSPAAKHVVTSGLVVFFILASVATVLQRGGWTRFLVWVVIIAFAHLFWFFCYTIADRTSQNRDPISKQVGLWHPGWMLFAPSGTPYGKGAAYLRRIEAQTPEELAVVRLKGLKLLLWAVILRIGASAFQTIVYGRMRIPEYEFAFRQSVAGHPLPWYANGLSLVAAFLWDMLALSIGGHQIIACLRLAGFCALRNTYRPFESRTVADFWNRYYFYFKEVLVDMFFYPTWLRWFKKHRRIRMIAATFMAAAVGNFLFHFCRDIGFVAEVGWRRDLAGFETYLFYCVVLATGISISQLRNRRGNGANDSWFRSRFMPIASVCLFYCFLHVFDDTAPTYTFADHVHFVGRLIGI